MKPTETPLTSANPDGQFHSNPDDEFHALNVATYEGVTATEGIGDDESLDSGMLGQILARFGPRTHLQPKEIVKLIGLRDPGTVNGWIRSGALLASSPPGCDRLRFVELDEFLRFMRDNQRPSVVTPRMAPRTSARETQVMARVLREGGRTRPTTQARSL
jgi:hypothetical protein